MKETVTVPSHLVASWNSIFSNTLLMPILLTAENVDIVLGGPTGRLRRLIPEVFEKLLEPSLDDFTRYTYCVSPGLSTTTQYRIPCRKQFMTVSEFAVMQRKLPQVLTLSRMFALTVALSRLFCRSQRNREWNGGLLSLPTLHCNHSGC